MECNIILNKTAAHKEPGTSPYTPCIDKGHPFSWRDYDANYNSAGRNYAPVYKRMNLSLNRILNIPIYRACISVVFSAVSALALLATPTIASWEAAMLTAGSDNPVLMALAKLRLATDNAGVLGLFVVLALFLVYDRFFKTHAQKEKKLSVGGILLSFIFSLIMLVGMSIQSFGSLDFLLADRVQLVYSCLLLFGFWCLFYVGIEMLFGWLDSKFANGNAPSDNQTKGFLIPIQSFLVDRKPFLLPMLFLLLCWLPVWIAYFPGSVMWDMLTQYNYFFGVTAWSDHHPVIATLLYGTLLRIGRWLGSDNIGVFLGAFFQHLLLSSCMAYSLCCMKKWGVARAGRFLTLLFYAFCPIVSFWPSNVVKDCTYFALALLFGTLLINLIQAAKMGNAIGKRLLPLTLTGIAIPLIRHDGLYICIIVMLLFAVFFKMPIKRRIACVISAIMIGVVSTALSNAAIDMVNATEGSSREALSVPFQQTARYVKEHGDEVTPEERAAIDAVLDYDRLPELYDPDLSDPVKATYRGNDDALPDYFTAWFRMLLKHPVTYIEATLCNSYSYYYPNGESTVKAIVLKTIPNDPSVNTGFFNIEFAPGTGGLRAVLYNAWLYLFKNLPGIGLLIHAGTYTWILLLAAFYALHRAKPYLLLGLTPAVLNILVCICSPVNGYFRYFIPTILLTPVLVCWILRQIKNA